MIDLKLFALHRGQRYIGRLSKRFNAVRCGRRWGKTKFGVHRLLVPPGTLFGAGTFVPVYPVGWFAPTYKYLSEVWKEVNDLLSKMIVSRNKTDKQIVLKDGRSIDFWTLDDSDAGRSRKYRHVIVDEAAKVRNLDDAWNKSIRPTLADYRGTADFLSTPKGRDYFAHLCDRGTWVIGDSNIIVPADTPGARPLLANDDGSPQYPDFAAFHAPTSSNPYIHPDEIESNRRELPDLVFRQEFLAEFVDFAGTVVKREWLRWGDPLAKWEESQLVTCMGGDLAISLRDTADFTALVVLSKDPDGYYWIRYVERGRLSFRDQIRLFAHVGALWRVRCVFIEDNQYQAAAVQELLATTPLAVIGYTSDKDKLTKFMPVQARYQRGFIIHGEQLRPEFEGELLSFTGDDKLDDHDDYVDALSLAYQACNSAAVEQPRSGDGARVAVAGGAISPSIGFGAVKVRPR